MSTAGVSVQEAVAEWLVDTLQEMGLSYQYLVFERGVRVMLGKRRGEIKLKAFCTPDVVNVEDQDDLIVLTAQYADPRLFEQLSEVICRLLG